MNSKNIFRIKSLYVKNFKSIIEASFKFDENNLIIFDGPNGYGKTTAFEAIEIILSKTPRKYRTILIDAKISYTNSPIHKDENSPIELILHLNNNEQSLLIKRYFEKAPQKKSQDNNIKNIFETSKLFINEKESTEDELEKKLNFPNVNILFNVLNYVEQDENTFFLKKNPKERYKELSSLLGAEHELFQLEKIRSLEKDLSGLFRQKKLERDNIIERNREILSFESSNISYKQLIKDKAFAWDQENIINADINIRNSYLSEVEKIKYLYSNKELLKDIYDWHNIQTYLSDDFLEKFISMYWKIENYEILKAELEERKRNDSILRNNQALIEAIYQFNYSYLNQDSTWEYLQEKGIDIDILKTKLTLFVVEREALGTQSKVLNDLKNKRTELLSIQREHKNLINLTSGECPTCGFDWESSDILINHIQQTEQKIFREYNVLNIEFEKLKEEINSLLESFRDRLAKDSELITEITNKLITYDSFAYLEDVYLQQRERFDAFLNYMNEDDKVFIIALVNNRLLTDDQNNLKNNIRIIINQKKPNIDSSVNTSQLLNDLDVYFQNNTEPLNSISEENINNKSLYIITQYNLAINKTLTDLNEKIEQLESFLSKVQGIMRIFDKAIKDYTKNIVDTVTIPFYIYTGKILQRHSLGSGLVLDLDVSKKDPQLKINPAGRDQEVSYTLSSGQLSATVISLMLVLNKVYSKSKFGTILIDDPLQTLDEINTHSLIEVLKYNFSDQQVVLSTHEDRYSKLIRYKYDKFNLLNKNIRMKDIF